MSAPDTNLPRQSRRHFIPLLSLFLVTLTVVIGAALYLTWTVSEAETAAAAPVQLADATAAHALSADAVE